MGPRPPINDSGRADQSVSAEWRALHPSAGPAARHSGSVQRKTAPGGPDPIEVGEGFRGKGSEGRVERWTAANRYASRERAWVERWTAAWRYALLDQYARNQQQRRSGGNSWGWKRAILAQFGVHERLEMASWGWKRAILAQFGVHERLEMASWGWK